MSTYKEVFVRTVYNEDTCSEKTKTVTNTVDVRKGDNEKAQLPRKSFKPTSRDISCSALCKIPEEITLTKPFPYVDRSEVWFGKIPKYICTCNLF